MHNIVNCKNVPRLSLGESELDSSTAEELDIIDSVEESNEFKSRSRFGVE